MDIQSEGFDGLPDEVAHLIFSFIADCKSLVRCMSVSKAFRDRAIRIASLSIVCPGSFSSYEERLHKIYAMVKPFKFLNSLVVRVGQPKEETPSWARCMRYAEIGSSVEKFVFMAAKSGDFSELDLDLMEPRDGDYHLEECNGCGGASGDGGSDEGGQRTKPGMMLHRRSLSDASVLREVIVNSRKQLSENFCLRRVVAPTNDVLTRMLPVIHFAIVQGLNELRDAMPPFISRFPELRRFLLVDMAESITVFLREHHIEQMKALYAQELDELSKVHTGNGRGDDIKEVYSKLPTFDKVETDEENVAVASTTQPSGLADSLRSSDGNACLGIEECSGNGHVGGSFLSLTSECNEEIHGVSNVATKLKERKGKSIMTSMINGTCTYRRKKGELQTMSPLSRSYIHRNAGICKGKSKALDHNDFLAHIEGCSQENNLGAASLGTSDESDRYVSTDPCLSKMGFSSGIPSNLLHSRDAQPMNGYLGNASYAGFYLSRKLNMNAGSGCIPEEHHGSEAENKLPISSNPTHLVEELNKELDDDIENSSYASEGLRFYKLGEKDGGRSSKDNAWLGHSCSDRVMDKNMVTKMHHHDSSYNSDSYCKEGPSRICNDLCDDDPPKNTELRDDLNPTKFSESSDDLPTGCNELRSDDPSPTAFSQLRSNDPRTGCDELSCNDLTECNEACPDSSRVQSAVVEQRSTVINQTVREPAEALTMERSSFSYTEICRRTWQERVTRLRDCLRVGPLGQEQSQHHRRERSRELLRKRQLAMEQDALSFDYTFWRSDRISSCNYVMSDISMCIVTNAAKPLEDADKKVLMQAAIAGPLLVATVSHVNKQYTCHNL